jgi:hypothetical protein
LDNIYHLNDCKIENLTQLKIHVHILLLCIGGTAPGS